MQENQDLSEKVRKRDGYRCRLSGVWDSSDESAESLPSEKTVALPCETVFLVPSYLDKIFWQLTETVFGCAIDAMGSDTVDNAILACGNIPLVIIRFAIYFEDRRIYYRKGVNHILDCTATAKFNNPPSDKLNIYSLHTWSDF